MSTRAHTHHKPAPYLFLAPFMIVFVTFTVYPLIQSLVLSLHQTFGPGTSTFVGLQNFSDLLRDPLFWRALKNTAIYALGSLFLQLPLSLGLALMLNHARLRGRALFRLIFFSPSLVGIAFVAVLFGPFLEKNTGVINVGLDRFLRTTGLHYWISFDIEFAWLESFVMPSLILASLWMYTGFNMIYFLAALQTVDRQITEAALVDGAGPWSRLLHVTLPSIRPVALYITLLSLIGSFQLFELPYILLNFGGGPDNRGLTVVMYLFQNGFVSRDLGYASAIGWSLTILLIIVAILQRRIARRYEDGG